MQVIERVRKVEIDVLPRNRVSRRQVAQVPQHIGAPSDTAQRDLANDERMGQHLVTHEQRHELA